MLGVRVWACAALAWPIELLLTGGSCAFYVRRTRGPVGPPLVLLAVMLLFQALNWFGPHPESAGPFLYLQALLAFAILTALAVWVGENRWFQKRGGLAFGDQ